MDGSYEHIVIGGGLAGTTAAYFLSQRGSTLLVEKSKVGAGASGAIAGLINPFMSRKANPVWHWREALDSFERLTTEADLTQYYLRTGILRPAAALPQKLLFRDVSREFPEDTSWLQGQLIAERWPAVSAQNGALFVHRGGGVEMEPYVRGLARSAEARGCEVRTGCHVKEVREDGDAMIVRSSSGDFRGNKVILCTGGAFAAWPQVAALRFHPIKGQLIETPVPGDISPDFPCLAGGGYVVRLGKRLILGSTFRHTFDDLAPTQEDTEEIIRKTATLLPVVRVAAVKRAWTGIRVTVPQTRLPVVGPIDRTGRLWVFTGLGSKGILMSSLIAPQLHDYLRDPALIPEQIRVA